MVVAIAAAPGSAAAGVLPRSIDRPGPFAPDADTSWSPWATSVPHHTSLWTRDGALALGLGLGLGLGGDG